MYKRSLIYMKKFFFQDDKGIFSENIQEREMFEYESDDRDFYYRENATVLFEAFFFSSPKIEFKIRKYIKLFEVFANIGGAANFLLILGFILTSLENVITITLTIINSLYIFQKNDITSRHRQNNNNNNNNINQSDILPKGSTFEQLRSSGAHILTTEHDEQAAKNFLKVSGVQKNAVEDFEGFSSNKNFINIVEEQPDLLVAEENHRENTDPRDFQFKRNNRENDWMKKSSSNARVTEKSIISFSSSQEEKGVAEDSQPSSSFSKRGEIDNSSRDDGETNQKKRKTPKSKFHVERNYKITSKEIEEGQEIKNRGSESLMDLSAEKLLKLSIKRSNLTINSWEYLKFKMCACLLRKRRNVDGEEIKRRLFEQAEERYFDEIDVIRILQRLQELEKLRDVLLSPEQNAVLNLISKPIIVYDSLSKSQNERSLGMGGSIFELNALYGKVANENNGVKLAADYLNKLSELNQFNEVQSRLMQLVEEKMKKIN